MRHSSPITHSIGQISFIASIFVTILSFYTLAADAFPDTAVIVEPNSSSVVVGETFSINVTVVDVHNLYGLEVILSWDSTILALVNMEVQLGQNGGVLNAPVYIADNSTQGSRYTISATSTSPAPSFSGTGSIVHMNFSVIGTGACKLELQTQLYDYPPPDRDPRLSLPIVHTDVDGFFQGIIPEFPGYLFFVATAMLTLLSVVFSKQRARAKHEQAGHA
jgi:hypothetical protein